MGEMTSLPPSSFFISRSSPLAGWSGRASMAISPSLAASRLVAPLTFLPVSFVSSSAAPLALLSSLDPINTSYLYESLAASPLPRGPVPPTIPIRLISLKLRLRLPTGRSDKLLIQQARDFLRPLPAYPAGQGEVTLRQAHPPSRRSVLAEQPLRELASDSGEGRDKVNLLLREALAPRWRLAHLVRHGPRPDSS